MLRNACVAKDIEYIEIQARNFDFQPQRQLVRGDMMYRPAVSIAAQRTEQFLYAPEVATFYRDPEAVYYTCTNPTLLYQRSGLPIARTVFCTSPDRNILRAHVEFLGGFPLVLKFSGNSGGIGVIKLDGYEALFSVLDFALAQGQQPILCAYIENAIHWRILVVGNKAIARYRNPIDVDDFRSFGSTQPEDFSRDCPTEMETIAVQAAHLLRQEFGGVDVLEHESGRLYLLECNFPCYHPHAEKYGGIDVSGQMVEFLMEKSLRLSQA